MKKPFFPQDPQTCLMYLVGGFFLNLVFGNAGNNVTSSTYQQFIDIAAIVCFVIWVTGLIGLIKIAFRKAR